MLEKVKEFFELMYEDTAKEIECYNYTGKTLYDIVWGTVEYCSAVALFAQFSGVDHDEVESLYGEYEEKLENLLTF